MSTGAPPQNAQEIMQQYEAMRAQIREYAKKLGELDSERNEHSLVVTTIKDLDSKRKCFRKIGGVLVERTIGEVLPAVQRNLQGIDGMIKTLSDTLKDKQKVLDDYKEKYNIRPASQVRQQGGGRDGKQ